ncbi:MAG: hypothetical protein DRG59_10230, partial [Deltaproteobacteria bacterium]
AFRGPPPSEKFFYWGRVVQVAPPDPIELVELQIFGKYLTVRKILSTTFKRGETVLSLTPQWIWRIKSTSPIPCPTTDREVVRHARGGVL